MSRALALVSLFALAACGGTIDAKHYRQTCAQDVDCAPVFSGDVCTQCRCSNAAISATEVTRYQADLRTLSSFCPPSGAVCLADCVAPVARCLSGTCALPLP